MTKIKCFKCGDVIQSDGYGKFVECSCGSCYIDETKSYCRIGGDFDRYYILQNGKWVLAKKVLRRQQRFAGIKKLFKKIFRGKDGTRKSD